ncbi:methyl-accepting chemotaxis protein [Massilia forsythiae]|uniref:Methyl-accepting chemotaxis protein n=1 Tax=Massilia forsythiae TaxID=2728020 RepID=A0A7Z2VWU8_9BURK|nr:methyl-accepting chemotaxis protein [Massilia forsythiae]QJE00603.1 methyl-accepting chemotaxis protein [Massilia forsythiae]
MGLASKLSIHFLPKDKDDGNTVLASPDTQFGVGLMAGAGHGGIPAAAAGGSAAAAQHAAGAPAAAAPAGSADDAALRLGNLPRRKQRAAAAAAAALGAADDLRLPLIGHLSLPRQLRILLSALAIGILLTILSLWRNAGSGAVAAGQAQIASEALMHSQRVGKAAPNAMQGIPDAFDQLQDSRRQLNRDLALLAQGGEFGNGSIPAAAGEAAASLGKARAKWAASDAAAATILATRAELTAFDKNLKQLDQLSPEMLALTEEVLTQRSARGGSPRELAALGRLMMLSQRLSRSAGEYLSSGGIRPETAFQMGRDTTTFRVTVDALLNGSDALGLKALPDADLRARLAEVRSKFEVCQRVVATFLDNLAKFNAAKGAEQTIFRDNEDLRTRLLNLQGDYRGAENGAWFWLLVAASIFTLAMAGSISRVMLQDSRNRTRGADARRQEAEAMRLLAQAKEEEAKATNDQNQAAILRLMNELQEVADGDLTVHATVSEDITGAIADSVNYTVEELRGLVVRVIGTAEQVTAASNGAHKVAGELLVAAGQQSREIQDASSTVLRMAGQITEVSSSAKQSAEVARQSVAAAEQGANAVQDAIRGMVDIREQIQDTSKRIKRLGESSQEIGEITELISDITEQTNVLALNAAIQAASAGEAGRGFSVVAEEVQRLAERSGDAAKQIGALVRTIQTDTHDAVAAMERSTQGVVEGARLSDAAGAALADISRVSNRLAELIQGIAIATGQQATSANGVAHNMRHILAVNEHTQGGTQQTAQSIRQLAELAQELKNSVSRFRVAP